MMPYVMLLMCPVMVLLMFVGMLIERIITARHRPPGMTYERGLEILRSVMNVELRVTIYSLREMLDAVNVVKRTEGRNRFRVIDDRFIAAIYTWAHYPPVHVDVPVDVGDIEPIVSANGKALIVVETVGHGGPQGESGRDGPPVVSHPTFSEAELAILRRHEPSSTAGEDTPRT